MFGDDDLLALSGLQHIAYCERQWALIHLEQEWSDSFDTVRGNLFHARTDTKGYSTLRGFRCERRVRLVSHSLGIYGIADIVEFGLDAEGGSVRPVEYKVGKPKIEDWDRIQVAAQAMCLEEMLSLSIDEGYLFYGETRRREIVDIDFALKQRVKQLCQRMHSLFEQRKTPLPLRSHKCRRCSLVDKCLPDICGVDARDYLKRMGLEL